MPQVTIAVTVKMPLCGAVASAELLVCLVVEDPTRVEFTYASTECGALYVMTTGAVMMPQWFAGSLDIAQQVSIEYSVLHTALQMCHQRERQRKANKLNGPKKSAVICFNGYFDEAGSYSIIVQALACLPHEVSLQKTAKLIFSVALCYAAGKQKQHKIILHDACKCLPSYMANLAWLNNLK
jgi:hypothetical protein